MIVFVGRRADVVARTTIAAVCQFLFILMALLRVPCTTPMEYTHNQPVYDKRFPKSQWFEEPTAYLSNRCLRNTG